jgi:hypothetical protein
VPQLDPGPGDVPRVVDKQAASLSDQLEFVAERENEAAVEVREDAIREAQRGCKDDVDAALADYPIGLNRDRFAAERPYRVHAVAADVHQGAAVELRIEPCVAGPVHCGELEAERGPDDARPPDRALCEQSRDRPRLGVMPPHKTLREDEPLALGVVEGLLGLCHPAREGLLAEDGLPGCERPSVHSTCIPFGSDTWTASTSGSSRSAL